MAHMIPVYTQDAFVETCDAHGEIALIPADVFDGDEDDVSERYEAGTKWFCRLSAPGYMDATDWNGPFDTREQAQEHVLDTYEVDPETGEETTEIDPEDAGRYIFGGRVLGILQQSNRQALESEVPVEGYDEKQGTIIVQATDAAYVVEFLNALTDYPIADDGDYYERERALKEEAMQSLPFGEFLDAATPEGHPETRFYHAKTDRREGDATTLGSIASILDSELLPRFEENMSEYDDNWNGSQIDYREDRLKAFFVDAVRSRMETHHESIHQVACLLGFYDQNAEDAPTVPDDVVEAFKRVHGDTLVPDLDPELAALRKAILG